MLHHHLQELNDHLGARPDEHLALTPLLRVRDRSVSTPGQQRGSVSAVPSLCPPAAANGSVAATQSPGATGAPLPPCPLYPRRTKPLHYHIAPSALGPCKASSFGGRGGRAERSGSASTTGATPPQPSLPTLAPHPLPAPHPTQRKYLRIAPESIVEDGDTHRSKWRRAD